MKIVHYKLKSDRLHSARLGILVDEKTILDPNYSFELKFQKIFSNPRERAIDYCPPSLHRLLRLKNNPIDILKEALNLKEDEKYIINFSTSLIKFESPLDKIETYRDFYAHEKHVKTGFQKRNEEVPPAWYEIPAYYKGATQGFIGHEDEILWPSYTDILDYELELGMIIGKDGRNISVEDASKYIFGFTILNDISARDIQRKEMSIRLGPAKGKDFCSILGPVIVTFDEFHFKEPNLLMTAKINGIEWSRGFSGDSQFTWAQMINHVSKDEWILAGDLFGSGTVGTGCGLELDKWIKSGDIIELEIEKIGKLINKVGNKKLKK
jgi:2-keto-4-pentenoate hydratase/2-oxohepta-3-ene-1,7-dioic acid hydratase in catechol pathway